MKVLVVEDDASLGKIVVVALRDRGFDVALASGGRAALDAARADEPDVVILDLGLPDIDGVEVCHQLRRWTSTPIIVLSADGAEDRKIDALDAGADDYVTKPFSMPELFARVRVAQRHRAVQRRIEAPVTVGALTVDQGARIATVDGVALDLTRKAFDLLALLASNAGRVLTHGQLLSTVWGDRAGSVESLRVHVTQLRRAIGDAEDRPVIESDAGVGYRLALRAER